MYNRLILSVSIGFHLSLSSVPSTMTIEQWVFYCSMLTCYMLIRDKRGSIDFSRKGEGVQMDILEKIILHVYSRYIRVYTHKSYKFLVFFLFSFLICYINNITLLLLFLPPPPRCPSPSGWYKNHNYYHSSSYDSYTYFIDHLHSSRYNV